MAFAGCFTRPAKFNEDYKAWIWSLLTKCVYNDDDSISDVSNVSAFGTTSNENTFLVLKSIERQNCNPIIFNHRKRSILWKKLIKEEREHGERLRFLTLLQTMLPKWEKKYFFHAYSFDSAFLI